jgi:hypothetical protein
VIPHDLAAVVVHRASFAGEAEQRKGCAARRCRSQHDPFHR